MPMTGKDFRVDVPLTNISIGYRNRDYIADEIFPIVQVNNQSGIVPKYDQSHWFRDGAKVRAPGTKSERGTFSPDLTDTYFAQRKSFGYEVTDDDRDNAALPFDLERDGAEYATDKIFMNREVSFATDFFATGVWGTDKVGATDFTKWSDYGGSNPLSDFTDWDDVVSGLVGRRVNMGVVGRLVWSQLKWHPDVLDLIKYTQRGVVSTELFASLVELDRFMVGESIQTTTQEGVAEGSVTYTRIWGKNALLLYTPGTPSLITPACGYTFVWNRVPNFPIWIKRMRDEEKEITIIEANSYFDQKTTATNSGLFASAAVA